MSWGSQIGERLAQDAFQDIFCHRFALMKICGKSSLNSVYTSWGHSEIAIDRNYVLICNILMGFNIYWLFVNKIFARTPSQILQIPSTSNSKFLLFLFSKTSYKAFRCPNFRLQNEKNPLNVRIPVTEWSCQVPLNNYFEIKENLLPYYRKRLRHFV